MVGWIAHYTCCTLGTSPRYDSPIISEIVSSRRGVLIQMASDNGRTFVAAAQIIDSVLNCPEVQQHFASMEVKWIFNLEKAPWWGGFFETMVQLMKWCLRKAIGKTKLTYDKLVTVLTEVEAIITGHCTLSLPDGQVTVDINGDEYFTINQQGIHGRMSTLKQVLAEFWDR